MVNEARAYRERVLSELARRRELAREQIEQLMHGRDRLMQAFERARVVAVDVVAELKPLGEPDEYVNLSPTTGPVPVMVPNSRRPDDTLASWTSTPMPTTPTTSRRRRRRRRPSRRCRRRRSKPSMSSSDVETEAGDDDRSTTSTTGGRRDDGRAVGRGRRSSRTDIEPIDGDDGRGRRARSTPIEADVDADADVDDGDPRRGRRRT